MTSSLAIKPVVLCSGPDASKRFAFARALTAALHPGHTALLWTEQTLRPENGRSLQDLRPYLEILSPPLLRNFLQRTDRREALLDGLPPLSELEPLLSRLSAAFDIIVIVTEATWDALFLTCLDHARAYLWIEPVDGTSQFQLQEAELLRHKIPKHIALSISSAHDHTAAIPLSLMERLEAPPLTIPVDLSDARSRVHQRLLEAVTERPPVETEPDPERLLEALIGEDPQLPQQRQCREELYDRLRDDVVGFGPLQPLLRDPTISEIMVNGFSAIFVERAGRLQMTTVRFDSEHHLRTVIDRIVAPVGRRVDESSPICDARLPDGSRVNILLPPLALNGPALTIRKFPVQRLRLDDLIAKGCLNEAMAQFLVRCVQARKTILVSGGTGSGKTTLLNALSDSISPDERIVTIEDAAELQLGQFHVVRTESRPANAENQGAVPIRRLVANALRMRPDRIIVGECRGGEAFDMLQAMNTGHDGSLTTIHANSPRDALGRLEALVLMAGIELPMRVVCEQMRSAIHFIVQMTRFSDGTRRVTSIAELTGMEGDTLCLAELFLFNGSHFESSGLMPQAKL